MDDGGPTASIFLFIFLILVDMIFYGFSAALRELNIKEIAEKAENESDKKAKRLYTIISEPRQHINTVQLVMTLSNVIMGGYFLNRMIKGIHKGLDVQLTQRFGITEADSIVGLQVAAVILGTIFLMYIILTFGVMIPKRIGAHYSQRWSMALINPAFYTIKLLSPITGLISLTTRGILRLLHIRIDNDSDDVTEEEIISMVNEGHEQGVLLANEAEMITNIFEYGDKEARDIMTHRNNIIAIDKEMLLKDAIEYMLEESKSRFPVYEENIDHIIGVLHFRDAMRAYKQSDMLEKPIYQIEGLYREVVFIPETKNIDALFQMMQQTKTQMVIVVDEYGQTSGLIAMEDILEEIVGNIMDEYDEDEEYIEETENKDEYIIEGKTPLKELEEKFDISFEEEEFETLNGFLIAKMDHIPEENEEFDIDVDEYNFKILSVNNKMIQSVLVTKQA